MRPPRHAKIDMSAPTEIITTALSSTQLVSAIALNSGHKKGAAVSRPWPEIVGSFSARDPPQVVAMKRPAAEVLAEIDDDHFVFVLRWSITVPSSSLLALTRTRSPILSVLPRMVMTSHCDADTAPT